MTIMIATALLALRRLPRYLEQVVEQYIYIGKRSLPLIVVSAVFMGLLMGVQIGTQMSETTPAWVEGGLILRTVLLEMGPIIMGIVLSGRVGSGIASELGTMKITEQVDALRTMGINPIEYLVMPRLLSGVIAFTTLIVFFDFLAIISAFVSSYFTIDMTWAGFVRGMRTSYVQTDIFTSLIKAFIFGFLVTGFGTFFGLETKTGAKGVGSATTNAVIWSSIAIIVLDYIISATLYMVW
jgi:phospholipid/cholesterol/gamma-HCH transport system permease protein